MCSTKVATSFELQNTPIRAEGGGGGGGLQARWFTFFRGRGQISVYDQMRTAINLSLILNISRGGPTGKNAWNQVLILQMIFKSSEKSLCDLT